ncbi:MAG: trans-2-enoyl-CoA reductase family protein [Bacillota bacterium]|nr:trans-2-enoyl-CoA reductase family protein [Bacillota bacterium]
MIIKPKFRGPICIMSHPEGCEQNVLDQINYAKEHKIDNGPKKVLVIGSSTGYGLASRIISTFSAGAETIGVFYERPAVKNRTASAGWYNTVAFDKAAKESGYYSRSINGDAFSEELKRETIELIKKDWGKVDLIIYSLAAPRRIHPITGETYSSVIKPIGKPFVGKTIDFHDHKVTDVVLEPASELEIAQTVAVMGGEDWEMWIDALKEADVLAEKATTVAYSYIGPEVTHAIYRSGTIGRAKDHLEDTAIKISERISHIGGRAFVSVNKAVVTQASLAIPAVPLYISILYKVMKEKELHEDCIEQIYRLYKDWLYADKLILDNQGRIRVDDWEMREDVQEEVLQLWNEVNSDNVNELSDIDGFAKDFFKLFGFGIDSINYNQEINQEVEIPNIINKI